MVKPGYKQTEIGLIPTDWTTSKLGNIGQFKNGINKDKDKFGYGVPIIGLMEIFGVNHINSVANSGLVDATLFEQEDYSVKEGDVLFVRSSVKPAGVGLAAVVENDLQSAVFSGFLLRYRTTTLTTGFKRYAFYAPYFRENLIAASTVSANTNINQDSLKQLVLAYPESEHEQNTIGEVLSDVDAFIADLERLIAKKKAIKQGAMQELLTGKKRLPGFSGEWKSYQLRDLGEFLKGSGISRAESNTGKIPAVRYGELYTHHHNYVLDHISHISKEVAAKAKHVFKGDILFAASGETKEEIGKCAAIISKETVYAGGDILIFRPSVHLNPIFMGTLLNTADVCRQRAEKGQGDAVVHIHADSLGSIKIRIPEISEQDTIADILFEMDQEIKLLEQKLEKYRQVKQGMMQQLLTGKIRLV